MDWQIQSSHSEGGEVMNHPNVGPLVILGKSGQLSYALQKQLGSRRHEVLGRPEIDFLKPESIAPFLDRARPKVVLNTAAYTQVDNAENPGEAEKAQLINGDSVGVIAQWCAANDASLIHYSTDYVFSGTGTEAWRETDPTNPINVYGRTKLEGEQQATRSGAHVVIFRTSWIYGARGANFFLTMQRFARERAELRIVHDQIGAPTYVVDLARASLQVLDHPQFKRSSGIYHLAGSGQASWYEFAQAIFEISRARFPERCKDYKLQSVKPVTTAEFGSKTPRSLNSRFDQRRVASVFGIQMPDWRIALERCVDEYFKSSSP